MNDLLSAERVFRLIIDEAKDFAIFLLDAQGRIETWNTGAERIFGYRAEEAVGRHFSILFVPADRATNAPERELAAAVEHGRAEDTRWHLRKDGSAFFADGVTTTIRDDDGTVIGFSKIGRDITERYRTEQRLAAQLALTNLLNEDEPFTAAAPRVMQTICENLKWEIGVLWDVDPDRDRLRGVQMWHAPAVDAELADELCGQHTFARGEGLPGEVWETGKPLWVMDFSDGERYPRVGVARSAGMRSAFAFPITLHGRVAGVIELFSTEIREPDQALLPVMALIGAQIGDHIDRRRTAQALRDSEERYRVVLQTAQDAIFTIDAASRIRFCNAAVERIFGWTPEELIGKTLDAIMPERMRGEHHRGLARYVRTGTKRIPWSGVELPALHREGHEFPVEVSFGEWQGPDGVVFTGFARDITHRKRAEAQLEASLELEQRARADAESSRSQLERRAEEESAFRHLASALSGAIEMTEVLYEITNRATHVTRADGVYVERIIDSARNVEIVATAGRGTPPRGLRVAYPGSMTEEIIEKRQPVILADMSTFGRAMAPYLADSCPNCEVLVAPLVAENEPLGALVMMNSRASGRKFRDADIIRARTLGDLTSLALRRVRLMEQEREAKEKAEQAVRVRDETLGIVSHDLRNPLTKIALSADLLADAPPEEQREMIETIRGSARQMQRLIQDLLDVARLEAGGFSVAKAMIDAAALVREACGSQEPLAEQKRQKLVTEIAGPLPEICADRDRLVQVFANLIGNAMKFTPERGTITIEAKADARQVTFRVRDTGPGIREADLKNVFRPYWQAKKTAHMGAGLGLAIVRGIIEAHGGTVWAENAPGGGAVFTFTIPLG